MKHCDWCGEYKKVRLIESMESIKMRLADYRNMFNLEKYGYYRCEECDCAIKIQEEIDSKNQIMEKKKLQLKWKKKRDAILGENVK